MSANMEQKYPLLHRIGKILTAAADGVTAIARKVEAVPGKAPEMLALIIYAAAHLGMALAHEPFFDEAEAWQIARSVSLKTLFLETTHYEGHPPLWHLIPNAACKGGGALRAVTDACESGVYGSGCAAMLRTGVSGGWRFFWRLRSASSG